MRILLILAGDSTYRWAGPFRRGLSYAPLSLSTLAGLVPPELGAEITLLDEGVQDPASAKGAYDVVGISCVASSAVRAFSLAAHWRARGAFTVLGGAHATLCPRDCLAHADAVVAGPADGVWPALLRALAGGQRPGGLHQGPSAPGFTPPRRDLLPRGAYLGVPTLMSSQGCVHACDFCSIQAASGKRLHSRGAASVVEELRALGGRDALFLDPNLAADRGHAAELFEALLPLKLRWAGLASLELAKDPELLALAARSGCAGLLTGFESLSQASLDGTGKGFHRAGAYAEAVRSFHSHGIAVLGCFVLGFDQDGVEDLRNLPAFVEASGVDVPRFALLTPFPGTGLHARLSAEGRILTDDLALYDCEHVVYRPARMAPQELQGSLAWVWERSYGLASILKRGLRSRNNRLLVAASNLGFRSYTRARLKEAR